MASMRRQYQVFGDAAADPLAAISTVGPDGVRVLSPGAAMLLATYLAAAGVMQVSVTPPAVLVQGPAAAARAGTIATTYGHPSAMAWVQAELDKGRSIVVMTTTPGGIPLLFASADGATFWNVANNADNASPGLGQVTLTSVGTKAEEVAAAGAAGGNALFMASKIPAGGGAAVIVPQKAGMGGNIAVAALALLVVGGIYMAVRKKSGARARY